MDQLVNNTAEKWYKNKKSSQQKAAQDAQDLYRKISQGLSGIYNSSGKIADLVNAAVEEISSGYSQSKVNRGVGRSINEMQNSSSY